MSWRYKTSCAAYPGRYHQELGLPCQDSAVLRREGDVACAALADGAGSRASSEIGARCVTRHISRLLSREFDRLWAMEPEERGIFLVQSCQKALEEEEPPTYDLACTLLYFAGHRDGRYLAGHLGDGVQILAEGDTLRVFSPPENGESQNETFFITADNASCHLRQRQGTWNVPGALLLMSDGMSASLYQYETGQPASGCRTLARWLREGEEETVSRALLDNMERLFAKHSSDDLSLALLSWEPEKERELE